MADESNQNQQGYVDPNVAPYREQPQVYQQPQAHMQQQHLYGINNRGRRITFDFEMDTELNNVMRAGPLFDMRYGAPAVGSTINNIPMVMGEEKKRMSFKIPLLILAIILVGVGGFIIYSQMASRQSPTMVNEVNGFGYPTDTGEPIQGLPTPTTTQQRPYIENEEFIMPDELESEFPDTPEQEDILPPTTSLGGEGKPQAMGVKSQYKVQPVVYKPNNGVSAGVANPYEQGAYQRGYTQNQGQNLTNANDYRKINTQGQPPQNTKQNTNGGYAPTRVVPDSTGFSYAPNYQQAPK